MSASGEQASDNVGVAAGRSAHLEIQVLFTSSTTEASQEQAMLVKIRTLCESEVLHCDWKSY